MAVARADALKTPSELEKLISLDPTQFEQTKNMRTKLRDLATSLVALILCLVH